MKILLKTKVKREFFESENKKINLKIKVRIEIKLKNQPREELNKKHIVAI